MITVYTEYCTGSVFAGFGHVLHIRLLRLRRKYQFYLREIVTTFSTIFECSLTGLCICWLQIAMKHKRWIYSGAHFSLLPPRLFYAMFSKFLWMCLHLWWLLPNSADPTGKGKFGTMNLHENRNTFFCSSSGDGETKRGRTQIKPLFTYRLSAFPLISLCTKKFPTENWQWTPKKQIACAVLNAYEQGPRQDPSIQYKKRPAWWER